MKHGFMRCIVLIVAILALHLTEKSHAASLAEQTQAAEGMLGNGIFGDFGPIVSKTVRAARYSVLAAAAAAQATATTTGVVSVPYGLASKAIIRQDTPFSVFISFVDGDGNSTDAWTNSTLTVPYLSNYVYTASAPEELVSAWTAITTGKAAGGPLAAGVKKLMGNTTVKWVTCTGEGPAGGMGILCGAASALQYPEAGVDVITFGTPWNGFNTQFAWAFDRFVALYYLWPFNTATQLPAEDPPAANAGQGLAQAVRSLINEAGLSTATQLPNTPPAIPEDAPEINKDNVIPGGDYDTTTQQCYDSFRGMSLYGGDSAGVNKVCYDNTPTIKSLGVLAPLTNTSTLPPYAGLPPSSDCAPLICRAKRYLDLSCVGFPDDAATNPPPMFAGLPYRVLFDEKTNADAIVLWDASVKEVILLWKYTEEGRDWLTDANAIRTEGYIEQMIDQMRSVEDIYDVIRDPETHAGFKNQFASLAIENPYPNNITAAVEEMSGGETPLFVTSSGFSLGGGLSELGGLWAAYRWPEAYVSVINQGAPEVGNEDYVTWINAAVGGVYRYVYNLDEVPSTPPQDGYKVTRNPIWITREEGSPFYVLLQDRPEIRLGVTTWYDHWCEVFYVPILNNVTKSLSVPQWVYNAPQSGASALTNIGGIVLLAALVAVMN